MLVEGNRRSKLGFETIARKCSEAYDAYFRGEMLCQGSRCAPLRKFQETEPRRKDDDFLEIRAKMTRMEWFASLGARSASLAHELKQPLTVVNLSLDDALDELEAASSHLKSATEGLKEAVTQVPNMTLIIDRFRSLTRYPSDNHVSEIDARTVAERIAKLFGRNQRQLEIILNLDDMAPLPRVRMNEKDLEQLFFCLFENAVHAAEGLANRQLVVDGRVTSGQAELRFSDNCGGIPQEHINKVFEPFFTTKPRDKGTGLGLSVVKEIVSHAGGSIRVESEFGQGTTFLVSLPLCQGGYQADERGQARQESTRV